MKYDENSDCYTLSTGTVIYANIGVLGIGPTLEVHEGFDGFLPTDDLTREERIELADHAIALWQAFKAL